MLEFLIEILGWIGMALIVGAYYLISSEKLNSTSQAYQLMNLAGAITLGFNVFYKRSWPAVALEIVWSAIAIYGLLKKKS